MDQILARPDVPPQPDLLAIRLDVAIEATYRREGWHSPELDRLLTLRLAHARRRRAGFDRLSGTDVAATVHGDFSRFGARP